MTKRLKLKQSCFCVQNDRQTYKIKYVFVGYMRLVVVRVFYGSQRLNYAFRTVPDEVKQSKKRQVRRWQWMVGLHNTV